MKVFRKIRSGRRRSSKTSQEANLLLSDSAYPSEASSVSSWGEGSSLSGSANHLFLLTEYNEETSNDETAPATSSMPAHMKTLHNYSPSNFTMMVYSQPESPRPLPDSINTWCKFEIKENSGVVWKELYPSLFSIMAHCCCG